MVMTHTGHTVPLLDSLNLPRQALPVPDSKRPHNNQVLARQKDHIQPLVKMGKVTMGQVTMEPVTMEPITMELVTMELVTMELVTMEPVTMEPVIMEPVTMDPATTGQVTRNMEPAIPGHSARNYAHTTSQPVMKNQPRTAPIQMFLSVLPAYDQNLRPLRKEMPLLKERLVDFLL